jgi:hypothetical protein
VIFMVLSACATILRGASAKPWLVAGVLVFHFHQPDVHALAAGGLMAMDCQSRFSTRLKRPEPPGNRQKNIILRVPAGLGRSQTIDVNFPVRIVVNPESQFKKSPAGNVALRRSPMSAVCQSVPTIAPGVPPLPKPYLPADHAESPKSGRQQPMQGSSFHANRLRLKIGIAATGVQPKN